MKRIRPEIILLTLFLIAVTVPQSMRGTLKLPAYYANNMVLQQNTRFVLHGKGVPGRSVRVICSWDKKRIDQAIGEDSTFAIEVTTPAAKMEPCKIDLYEMIMRDGTPLRFSHHITLSPVYVGEVWLCSGQSNMEMAVTGWGMKNAEQEKATAESYPYIKLLRVKRTANRTKPSDEEQLDFSWTKCSSSSVKDFSALAYLYGRMLYDSLRVPVGLIECCYGGANAQAWISLEKARQIPALKSQLDTYEGYGFDLTKIRAAGDNIGEQQVPTLLYNTMLHPLKGYPIRGAIWYQGEANAGNNFYTQLMDTLISSWRQDWGYDFPFYYMQLAGYYEPKDMQMSSWWAKTRQSQLETLKMPGTGMATCVDIGDPSDIHPKNKQEAARRLALVALRHTYGRNVVAEAPVPIDFQLGYKKAVITFNGPIHIKNDSVPVGFVLRDKTWSNKYYVGKATQVSDSVIEVTTTSMARVRSVYYDWADCPMGNLYGPNELPVLPFSSEETIINSIGEVRTNASGRSAAGIRGIYTADGIRLGDSGEMDKLRPTLPDGIYIIDGKKEIIKH